MLKTIHQVAVIGAGTMGRQIALQIAAHQLPVTLYDINNAALEHAQTMIAGYLTEWTSSGKIAAGQDTQILEYLRYTTDLATAVQAVDLVIESVPEKMDIKRHMFTQLDTMLPSDAIIATNSSSMRVSLLEDATERPEAVANLHFYGPVWHSPMVEIGGGSQTNAEVLDALTQFARNIEMLPLRVLTESTGFIFNRVWRAIKKEVLAVADSGVASIEDIDRAWMIRHGTYELPPFAKMDRIGLDVVKDIEEQYARESGDPSDLPPKILTDKVARGDLGQKTGRGFYTYPNPAYADPDFLKPNSST